MSRCKVYRMEDAPPPDEMQNAIHETREEKLAGANMRSSSTSVTGSPNYGPMNKTRHSDDEWISMREITQRGRIYLGIAGSMEVSVDAGAEDSRRR